MPTSRLQVVSNHYHRLLLAHNRQVQADLIARYRATRVAVQGQLDAIVQRIADAQAAGTPVSMSWLYTEGRLHATLDTLTARIGQWSGTARSVTHAAQQVSVRLGSEAAQATLAATVPRGIAWTFGTPPEAVTARMASALVPSSPVYHLFDKVPHDAANAARNALFSGVSLGQAPNVIAHALSSVADMPLQRARVIARSEVMRTWRGAQLANFRANSDVVGQWRWQSAKTPTSCAACLAMDGTLHDLSEDLEDHVCGKCVAVPITKSWADILGDAGIDTSGIPETSAGADEYQSGQDWFDAQDEATQRRILGPATYAAYQAGDIASLSDLAGKQHSPVWGASIYTKSLRQLGLRASDYLS